MIIPVTIQNCPSPFHIKLLNTISLQKPTDSTTITNVRFTWMIQHSKPSPANLLERTHGAGGGLGRGMTKPSDDYQLGGCYEWRVQLLWYLYSWKSHDITDIFCIVSGWKDMVLNLNVVILQEHRNDSLHDVAITTSAQCIVTVRRALEWLVIVYYNIGAPILCYNFGPCTYCLCKHAS